MNIKLIASAVGLFGGGVLFGWAFTADYYDGKLRNLLDNVDARVDIMLKKQAEMEAALSGKTFTGVETEGPIAFTWGVDDPDQPALELDASDEKSPEDVSGEEDVTYETIEEAETEVLRESLQKVIAQYTGDPDPEEMKHSIYDMNQTVVPDKTPPFIISSEHYAYDEEGDGYDKITLTYYPSNRILLDEEGDPMDDIAGIVGWKNLAHFGAEVNHPDTVFIRNRRLLTDFEVVKEDYAPLPIWVKYGMGREEFEVNKASGLLRVRDEDL